MLDIDQIVGKEKTNYFIKKSNSNSLAKIVNSSRADYGTINTQTQGPCEEADVIPAVQLNFNREDIIKYMILPILPEIKLYRNMRKQGISRADAAYTFADSFGFFLVKYMTYFYLLRGAKNLVSTIVKHFS